MKKDLRVKFRNCWKLMMDFNSLKLVCKMSWTSIENDCFKYWCMWVKYFFLLCTCRTFKDISPLGLLALKKICSCSDHKGVRKKLLAGPAFQLRSPIEWSLLALMSDDDSYLTCSCPHINSLGVWDRRKLSWDAAGLGGHGQQCGHTQGHSSRDSMLVKPETEISKLTLK